ncbi:MAG: hypothetical protein ACF8GE_09840 [Phycisphaerales bacterium JB043]
MMQRLVVVILVTVGLVLSSVLGVSASGEDFGVTSQLGSDRQATHTPYAMRVTLSADGTAESISAYMKGPPGKDFRVAIFENNSGSPGNLLVESSAVSSGSNSWHWETVTLTSTALTAGDYWLAICFEHNNQKIKYSSSGGTGSRGASRDVVDNGFEDPWNENSSNNYQLSLYATTSASSPPASPTLTPSVAVEDTLSMENNSGISGMGGASIAVSTNSTGSNDIHMKDDAEIQGDAYVGVSGNPNSVIYLENNANITGSTAALDEAVDIPDLSAPSVGGSTGDHKYTSGTTVISSDIRMNKLEMESSGKIRISGAVTIVIDNELKMKDSSQLRIDSGSSLTMYIKGDFIMENSAWINTLNADPADVKIYKLNSSSVQFKDDSIMYMQFVAHDALLEMESDARVYGTYHGKSLLMKDDAWFYGMEISSDPPAAPIITLWQEVDPN